MFIESQLCVKHWTKHFTQIISLGPHNLFVFLTLMLQSRKIKNIDVRGNKTGFEISIFKFKNPKLISAKT